MEVKLERKKRKQKGHEIKGCKQTARMQRCKKRRGGIL